MFIIKIQASLFSSVEEQQVLIYDEDKDIKFQENMSEQMENLMRGRKKVYFHAKMNGGKLEILEEAPDQDW